MPKKDRGLCDRCGQPNDCEPYEVERILPTGRPGDAYALAVCQLCWDVWTKKVGEFWDAWRQKPAGG